VGNGDSGGPVYKYLELTGDVILGSVTSGGVGNFSSADCDFYAQDPNSFTATETIGPKAKAVYYGLKRALGSDIYIGGQ